jgi:hypothetical protein
MIDPSNDDDLDALLGAGRMTGPASDRVFERVAAEVAREPLPPSRPRSRRPVWTIAAVAAGAAAMLVVAPRLISGTAPRERAKGGQAAALELDVACAGGTLAACPQGATLVFGASGAPGAGVLSAYAEPVDRGLERIWYFSAEGESPRLTVDGATGVATRAVRIGPEHLPGRYRIHLFLTGAPVAQAALLAGGARDAIASREIDLRVAPSP